MVESLAPMWAEEATRCGPSGIPDPPPSPPRSPHALCPAVDAVRQQFAAIAAEQQPPEPSQQQQEAGTPGALLAQALLQQAEAPGGTPLPVVLPTPATHGTPLLALTQAANQAALPQTGGLQPLSPQAGPAAGPAAGAEAALGTGAGPWRAGPAGDHTPATPLGFGLPQRRLGPGWQAGAGPPALLDEQLLMSQLTQQRERRLEQQQQQQQHWLASQQHQQRAEEAPEAVQLDAEAWAWLQVSFGSGWCRFVSGNKCMTCVQAHPLAPIQARSARRLACAVEAGRGQPSASWWGQQRGRRG